MPVVIALAVSAGATAGPARPATSTAVTAPDKSLRVGPRSPAAHVIRFQAREHVASFVIRQPQVGQTLEVLIVSPYRLQRGLAPYPNGEKQEKVTATVLPFNTLTDAFAVTRLNAGGGRGCRIKGGKDICKTVLPAILLQADRYRKLWFQIRKPGDQPAEIRILIR